MVQSVDLFTQAPAHPALEHPDILLQSIITAGVCIMYQTPDLVYLWAENLPSSLLYAWCPNYRDTDLFTPLLAEQLESIKLDVLSNGKPQTLEVRLDETTTKATRPTATTNTETWYKLTIACHYDQQHRPQGVITTAIDVSGLKQREKISRILLREVSHRSKNLLAIVSSLSRQTARYTAAPEQFRKDFEARILSLSQTQDLITEANWRGVRVKALIEAQLQDKICHQTENNINITGDDPCLFPKGTLYLGLALHELASHSKQQGALYQGAGELHIHCQNQLNQEGKPIIKLTWKENFPDNKFLPEQQDTFKNILLTALVPQALQAKSQYQLTKGHLCYQLSIPHTQFE